VCKNGFKTPYDPEIPENDPRLDDFDPNKPVNMAPFDGSEENNNPDCDKDENGEEEEECHNPDKATNIPNEPFDPE
jgi:hypothetical protein